jgi:N-acetyl-gamma-glutamyl-phosphate reductase
MAASVFIDGEAGTTGLQIAQRLRARTDITLLSIDPDKRKDTAERARLMNAASAVILCLPDEAVDEALGLLTNPQTVVIDASSRHRTAPGWVYGFPELAPGRRDAIRAARRISNPGCYPTGFLGLMAPLVRAGLIPADFPVTVNAVSGYSGGGKGLIAEFEGKPPEGTADAWRTYGMTLAHKHVPEMQVHAGLTHPPLFAPSVGRYAQGMIVEVPLQLWALQDHHGQRVTGAHLREALREAHAGEAFVRVADAEVTRALQEARKGAGGYVAGLDPEALNATNALHLFVFANEDARQARLVALLDNLGKGASGAAIQNLNLALGLPEGQGLTA